MLPKCDDSENGKKFVILGELKQKTMARPIRVGISHGDINGVGYEVILKALADETMTELCTPVIFGYHSIAEKARRRFGLDDMRLHKSVSASQALAGRINVVEVSSSAPEILAGEPTEESGKSAVAALEMASEALEAGDIDVLVTAPISKEAVQSETFRYPGHTEYLEARIGHGSKSRMILFDENVRVALVTTHLPISKVAAAITKESVEAAIISLSDSLKKDYAVPRPRIGVLSLNPHAGDGGLLGTEEKEIIMPAIEACREKGILSFGPFAADGFFGMGDYRHFDGIVAMYHDQGLAPFKTIAGERGVNFTAGLPYVRTSPDHGTAFGIAWKDQADPTSMREAIYAAIDIFRNRIRFEEASSDPLKKYVTERPERGDRPDRQPKKEKAEKPLSEEENLNEQTAE